MRQQLEWQCQPLLLWRGWHLCEAVGKTGRLGPMTHDRWQVQRLAERGREGGAAWLAHLHG
jgi:hypothetical protein